MEMVLILATGSLVLLPLLMIMQVEAACDVNTTIISMRENVPPGTVIMRLTRQSGEQWSFREDGPPGYIELKAYTHSVVFCFARTPDLEQLSSTANFVHESLPFTLECSYDGWKHVFKQSIVLMDENDNDPVFDVTRDTIVTVSENTSPGTTILHLQHYATDPDVSGYIMAYDLVPHMDIENEGRDYFAVSGAGNDLVVRRALDFDQMRRQGRAFYLLNLTAIDSGYPIQRKAYITLQINISDSDDQGPAFVYPDCPLIDGYCTTPLYETVAHKSFRGELKVWPGQVRAVDKDSINNTILYSIVSVSPGDYSGHFNVDTVTGKVQVVKSFGTEDIDAIHVTIKAEENSMTRRYLTSTLRVQVVGDYFASYKDSFRNVPVNEVAESKADSDNTEGNLQISNVPVSLFIATVAVFFLIVVSFPFIMIRVIKGKVLSEPARVTSLQLSGSDSPRGSRKESSDTASVSIRTYRSSDTCTTIYGPRGDNDSEAASSTSSTSSSSSSTSTSPTSSVRLNFDDVISFARADSDSAKRVSSVPFDPEEVSSRFHLPAPTRRESTSAEIFKRRVSRLFSFSTCQKKDKQKTRVRFDIRNISNFS